MSSYIHERHCAVNIHDEDLGMRVSMQTTGSLSGLLIAVTDSCRALAD